MATGYMDREYAKHHHELWYNEVKAQEEKENNHSDFYKKNA